MESVVLNDLLREDPGKPGQHGEGKKAVENIESLPGTKNNDYVNN